MEAPTLMACGSQYPSSLRCSEKGKGERTVQSLHLSPNLATVVWHWIEPCEGQSEPLYIRPGSPYVVV